MARLNPNNQRAQEGMRVTVLGIFVNMALAAAKGVAGVMGNSYALIADAVESSLDVFSSIVVWGGLRIAAIPPDKNHPYGHGKAEPLAAILVSVALVGAAVLLMVGSVHEILRPRFAPAPFTLLVLIAVIIIKEFLFRFVFRTAEKVGSTIVKVDAWHHRSDALTSLAAFIGITIAIMGGPGFESADDWAALVAAVIIILNAYRLFRPALDEIMDARPSPKLERDVRKIAMTVEGVRGIDTCHTRKMGLEFYVDLHITVDGRISVLKGHEIAHAVKDAIRLSNAAIADVIIHVEPDHH